MWRSVATSASRSKPSRLPRLKAAWASRRWAGDLELSEKALGGADFLFADPPVGLAQGAHDGKGGENELLRDRIGAAPRPQRPASHPGAHKCPDQQPERPAQEKTGQCADKNEIAHGGNLNRPGWIALLQTRPDAAFRASTAGSGRPSTYSRKAPPAVEI